MSVPHGLAGVADAGAFLARLTRLDPGAPVRLRTTGGRVALWARLPWDVLVTREVAAAGPVAHDLPAARGMAGPAARDLPAPIAAPVAAPADVTVRAGELLGVLARGGRELPARRDDLWRWPLPPSGTRVVETVAAAELVRLTTAAAGTLREVTTAGLAGRSVGQRAVRDALLDHVALVVTPPAGQPIEVSQRLVQGLSRMGFLGPAGVDGPPARVCVTGRWVGLSAPYGVAWLQPVKELTVMPISTQPFG